MTPSQPLLALRPAPAALALCLLLTLAASCGGESMPAPASAHGPAHEASSSHSRASKSDDDSDGPASEEAEASAPRALCDDGTCFACGSGSCPVGWYCDDSARGGAACSWLPECGKKPNCACVSKTLGSSCSCSDEDGGPHAKCK